ncbi:RNA-directed DNA polymerase protein [Dioscorea alata]|uniref:RNA-directed DNA polymerase protein n=1 Tax=Dioscorea alata TaxID=55571 RepID=A0ACB7WCZ8_DIOAL|nr:RNA-directed DNA polymerase protein [Dioscorea alata]
MASSSSGVQPSTVWLIDSGCSNHMTGDRLLFSNLNESQKITMRLGDDKKMMVCGVWTVTINTQAGTQKKLHGVQYVPGLAHNLLSMGQLLTKGYLVAFKKD